MIDRIHEVRVLMRASTVAFALGALLACSSPTPGGQGGQKKQEKQGRQERLAPTLLGPGVAVNPGVAEPSGIAFHPRLRHLFVVGDEGTLAELDGDGRFLGATPLGANLEDVAVHDPTGTLVLLDEVRAELIVYDPGARAVKGRWRLDTQALAGRKEKGRDGFEGLAFRPEAGRPGGGVFYLAHQRGPAMVVAVTFDPSATPGVIGASSVVGRWEMKGLRDLTALSWSPALGRLLLLADAEDELLLLRPDGSVDKRLKVPGLQQEGVCMDGSGDLWIADDRAASVVRYAGARKAMEGPATPGS
jgi:uncharacterized protein YjiK